MARYTDKQRLDWLSSKPMTIYMITDQGDRELCQDTAYLRQAIDAAMKAQAKDAKSE